jgi:hypothetical protein
MRSAIYDCSKFDQKLECLTYEKTKKTYVLERRGQIIIYSPLKYICTLLA